MQARFTVKTNRAVLTMADAMKLLPQDMKEMTVPVGVQFRANEKRLFSSEGSSGGDKWAALSPAYAKYKSSIATSTNIKTRKVRRLGSKKIMQRFGDLRKAAIRKGDRDHLETWAIHGDRATISLGITGEMGQRGAFHIKGSHNKVNPKHTRDVLAHTEEQSAGYLAIAQEWIANVKLARLARALLAGEAELRRRRSA